jgi:hypothetical protein
MTEKLGDHRFAETFNVHDSAGCKVAQLFFEPRRAVGVDAAPVDFAFGADEGAGACGAIGWDDDLFVAARVVRVLDDGDDLGDDISATLDLNEVTYASA